MRHVTSMLLLVLCLAACEPAVGYSSTQLVQETAQATNSEPAPSARPDPPPRPVCEQYDALEHGAGDWQTQDWHDHLDARGYAQLTLDCLHAAGADQWQCLDQLWQEESGWNHLAHNRRSGAHGIPQALPGSKMGEGWQTNPRVQVRWGISYVYNRYGSPCAALSHKHRRGWY